MTRFLVSDENPGGYKLEDILTTIRADVLKRSSKVAMDDRPEAQHVVSNNMEVLQHLTRAIELAKDSTRTLDKAFGPSRALEGGAPRVGVA
ncbi:MAG: histidine kinase [Alphaproteobacteria bacterium]|nr:histidine kinase [Alphaproteobacteria bacterium]